jgi:hypothetical protein
MRRTTHGLRRRLDSLVGNDLGACIKQQSTHPVRAVRKRLHVLSSALPICRVALDRYECWKVSFRPRISDASPVRAPDVHEN